MEMNILGNGDKVVIVSNGRYKDNEYMFLEYVKDNKFMEIVKSLKFKWIQWGWAIPTSSIDYMANICNILFSEGFSIYTENKQLYEALNSQEFEVATYNTIQVTDNKFKIDWKGKTDLYEVIKTIKTAKYIKGSFYIDLIAVNEVLEFAEINNFFIDDKSRKAIEQIKFRYIPVFPRNNFYTYKNRTDDIMDKDIIIDDLRDQNEN